MVEDFDVAASFVHLWECGSTCRPVRDHAGLTMHGITQRDHPNAFKSGLPGVDDFKAIFRSAYWDQIRPPTPLSSLRSAAAAGKAEGLRHIYVGNVPGESEDTLCASLRFRPCPPPGLRGRRQRPPGFPLPLLRRRARRPVRLTFRGDSGKMHLDGAADRHGKIQDPPSHGRREVPGLRGDARGGLRERRPGMASLMWDWSKVAPKLRHFIHVRGIDREQLLVKFLTEVIYLFETKRFLLGRVQGLRIPNSYQFVRVNWLTGRARKLPEIR